MRVLLRVSEKMSAGERARWSGHTGRDSRFRSQLDPAHQRGRRATLILNRCGQLLQRLRGRSPLAASAWRTAQTPGGGARIWIGSSGCPRFVLVFEKLRDLHGASGFPNDLEGEIEGRPAKALRDQRQMRRRATDIARVLDAALLRFTQPDFQWPARLHGLIFATGKAIRQA